jgi:hypothetical protein
MLRRIHSPIQDKDTGVLDGIVKFIIYNYLNIIDNIIRMEDERIPRKVLKGKLHNTRPSGKTKNKAGKRCPEEHITNPRNKRMEMRSGQEEWRHLLREARDQKRL